MALAVIALLAPLAPPAAGAQGQNQCASALAQVQKQIAKAERQLNDAFTALQTAQANELRDSCETPYDQAVAKASAAGGLSTAQQKELRATRDQCVGNVNAKYIGLSNQLQDERTTLQGANQQAQNDLGGNCPWSEQEIAQMIATIGDTVSKVTQSVAQVISAAKGNKSGGANGTQPGEGNGAAPPKPPEPPASPAKPAQPAPPPTVRPAAPTH